MVNKCSICKKPGDGGLFTMPSDPEQRFNWCLRLGKSVRIADENPRDFFVCADHFNATDVIAQERKKVLAAGALPITNLSTEQLEAMRKTSRRMYAERIHLYPPSIKGAFGDTMARVASDAAGPFSTRGLTPLKRKAAYRTSPLSTPPNKKAQLDPSSSSSFDPLSSSGRSGTESSTGTATSVHSSEEDETRSIPPTAMCLVYSAQLEILLRAKCMTDMCNSPVNHIRWLRRASSYTATVECFDGHTNSWSTQPKATDEPGDTMFRGNLDLTTATLAAGLAYSDIQRLAEVLDCAIMSQRSFYENQDRYVLPTVDDVYTQHMDQIHEILEELEEEKGPLDVAADAQCDSPGYSANLCCETFLEASTGFVASMTVVHKAETASKTSQAMEPFGFRHCLDELLLIRKRSIRAIVTDNHGGINVMMRNDYPTIQHQLDKWHIGKNLKKKLTTAAKPKGCTGINLWVRSILNHLWTSVDECGNNPLKLQELFRSVTYHVTNEHSWNDDQSFSLVSECLHDELSAEKVAEKGWLPKDSDAYRRLFAVLTNKRLLKDVGRIAENMTTSAVESYHSVRLVYAPKRKAYRYAGYRMRAQLGVLHHNFATIGKEPEKTAAGAVVLKRAYSKVAARWTEKVKNVRPSVTWKRGLLLDVRVERVNVLRTNVYRSLIFPNVPVNAAPYPRPIDERTEELFEDVADANFPDDENDD